MESHKGQAGTAHTRGQRCEATATFSGGSQEGLPKACGKIKLKIVFFWLKIVLRSTQLFRIHLSFGLFRYPSYWSRGAGRVWAAGSGRAESVFPLISVSHNAL